MWTTRARHRGLFGIGMVVVLALVSSGCGTTREPDAGAPAGSATSARASAEGDVVAPATTSGVTSTDPSVPNAPGSASGTGCPAVDGYLPVVPGRRALVHAPAAGEARPAMVLLHGYTGTPESIERSSGWTAFARDHGAVAVYPEGSPVPGGGFAWNTGSGRFSASRADDVAFLDALVATLVAHVCVDPGRIMIAGESNGGAMALLAACDPRTSGRFAMFAPVIPAVDQRVVERCGQGPPVTFTALASRLDGVVPYDGVYPPGQTPLAAQEAWFLQIAALRNRCSPSAPQRERIGGAEVIRPNGCVSPLSLVAIDDGSHTWPGGPSGTGGLPPGTFPATAYLWDLFAEG